MVSRDAREANRFRFRGHSYNRLVPFGSSLRIRMQRDRVIIMLHRTPLQILAFLTVSLGLVFTSASTVTAEIVPGTTVRWVPKTVYQSQVVTKYRPEDQVVVERKPITTYRTEKVTELRERRYRVAKPVAETTQKTERYKVRRPVTETTYRDEFMDRTRYESETTWEEQRRTVMKPVEETSERVEQRTVLEPVKEYDYKEERYTSYRPRTKKEVRWRDAGGYVNVPQVVPGQPGRSRLQWVPRTAYNNPQTGLPTTQRGGLYWVPQQGPPTVVNRPQYVPNYVPEEIERTTWEAEEVTRRVPVERTRYQEKVEYRKVPVTKTRWVEEEQYRFVPKTVKKPVTERYTRKVPVTRTRWVEEEVQRTVPQTTYRTEYEDRVEQVPVEVERKVPVQQLMEREKTIRRYVPYRQEKLIPKTVIEKQPIPDDFYPYQASSPIKSSVPQVHSSTGTVIRTGNWTPVVENSIPPASSYSGALVDPSGTSLMPTQSSVHHSNSSVVLPASQPPSLPVEQTTPPTPNSLVDGATQTTTGTTTTEKPTEAEANPQPEETSDEPTIGKKPEFDTDLAKELLED